MTGSEEKIYNEEIATIIKQLKPGLLCEINTLLKIAYELTKENDKV